MKKLSMPLAVLLSVCIVSVSSLIITFAILSDAKAERETARYHDLIRQASTITSNLIRNDLRQDSIFQHYEENFPVILSRLIDAAER